LLKEIKSIHFFYKISFVWWTDILSKIGGTFGGKSV